MFKKRKKHSLDIIEFSEKLPFAEGCTLLEALESENIKIDHSCGGMGTCGTCRVILLQPEGLDRNSIEQEMANEKSFAKNERLACQLMASENLKISLEPQKRYESDWYKSK